MKKFLGKKRKQFLFLVFFVLFILASALSFLVLENKTKGNGQLDEANNGVYVNRKCGFSYKYDKDLFFLGDYEYLYPTTLSLRNELETDVHQLTPICWSPDEYVLSEFEKLASLKVGDLLYSDSFFKSISKEKWPSWNTLKLGDLEIDGSKCVTTYYFYSGGGRESGPSWYYSLKCLDKKEQVVGFLLLNAVGEKELIKHKDIFDKIVSTFRII